MKTILLRLSSFLLVAAVVCELFFRLVVPATSLPEPVAEEEFGFILCDTASVRDGVGTQGRWAEHRNRWHVNNAGWLNAVDFQSPSTSRKPVIALIGDSYVNAGNVNPEEGLAPLLSSSLQNRFGVYGFGQGGAPLSQYVRQAKYAAQHYDPDVFVFLVHENDLRRSIRNYEAISSVPQVEFRTGEPFDVPQEYMFRPNRVKRIARHSATLRYLMWNANFAGPAWLGKFGNGSLVNARVPGDPDPQRLFDTTARYLVSKIAREHRGKSVLFVVDGQRNDIYARVRSGSSSLHDFDLPEYRALAQACTDPRCHVLNLAPVFEQHFAAEGIPFNSHSDYHWNASGYRVVAEAVGQALTREHIVDSISVTTTPEP